MFIGRSNTAIHTRTLARYSIADCYSSLLLFIEFVPVRSVIVCRIAKFYAVDNFEKFLYLEL